MTAVHHTSVGCNHPGCVATFGPVVGASSAARVAAVAAGWSHPSYGTDLCPAHKEVAS